MTVSKAVADGLATDHISSIAIALFHGGAHLGILHGNATSCELLHLAWHHDLRNDSWERVLSDAYRAVALSVDPAVLHQIAARCREIWRQRKTNQIPYGFSKTAIFKSDGLLNPPDGFVGLTCSTFVLAVMESCFVELVDHKHWPAEVSDGAWQGAIIDLLSKKQNVAPEHIDALRKTMGAPRYQPYDVAGAAHLHPPSRRRDEVRETAKLIERECREAAFAADDA